jgi:plastocyanin
MAKPMKMLIALSLIALAFSGCTSGDVVDDLETPPMNDAGEYVVLMTPTQKFVPATFQVPVGAVVLFQNEGGAHNVKSNEDAWTAGAVSEEDFRLTVTSDMVGENEFICVPHQSLGMIGNMHVTA